MTTFRVGQKVTLVKSFPAGEIARAAGHGVTLPSFGVVYTVRTIEPGVNTPWDRYIRVSEIINAPMSSGSEPNFFAELFKPVVERKSDISIFKAMLNKPTVRVDA